jgi:hypothetical protein
VKLRSPRPLEAIATLLAACGIGLLAIASVVGLRETRHGATKPPAPLARAASAAPVLQLPVRSEVAAHIAPAPVRHAQKPHRSARRAVRARKRTTAAPRARSRPRARTAPVRRAPAAVPPSTPAPAPRAPAPDTPPRQAPAPDPPAPKAPSPDTRKRPAAPPVSFNQTGTSPGSGGGSVPFDDSGSGR